MVLIVCMLWKMAARHPNSLPLHRVCCCELILFVIHPFSDAPSLFSISPCNTSALFFFFFFWACLSQNKLPSSFELLVFK